MTKSDVSIAQLRVLAAVVDAGGFTAAGERLGISQSGVSQAMAGLEGALGVRLLRRDRSGVALTGIGERVLGHARAALSSVERIRQEAAAAAGLETGKIRIGSFPSFAARVLPGIMKAFQARHPGVELVLLEGTDQEVREWLASRVVDVAAVALPVGDAETVPIARDEVLAVVPELHRLARLPRIEVAELAGEPLILSKCGCEGVVLSAFEAAGVSPEVKFEIRDLTTLLLMVQEGLGITLLPALAVPPKFGGVRTVPLAEPAWRELALAVHPGDAQAPAVRAFLREASRWAAALEPEPAVRAG